MAFRAFALVAALFALSCQSATVVRPSNPAPKVLPPLHQHLRRSAQAGNQRGWGSAAPAVPRDGDRPLIVGIAGGTGSMLRFHEPLSAMAMICVSASCPASNLL